MRVLSLVSLVAFAVAATFRDLVRDESYSLVQDATLQWVVAGDSSRALLETAFHVSSNVAPRGSLTCLDHALLRNNRFALEHLKQVETPPDHGKDNLRVAAKWMQAVPESDCMDEMGIRGLARVITTDVTVLCGDTMLLHVEGDGSSAHTIDAALNIVAGSAKVSIHHVNDSSSTAPRGFGGDAYAALSSQPTVVTGRTPTSKHWLAWFLPNVITPKDKVRVALDPQAIDARQRHFESIKHAMHACPLEDVVVRGVVGAGWAVTTTTSSRGLYSYATAFNLKYANTTETQESLKAWAKDVATDLVDMGHGCSNTKTLCFQTLSALWSPALLPWQSMRDHRYVVVFTGAAAFLVLVFVAMPAIVQSSRLRRSRDEYTSLVDPLDEDYESSSSSDEDDYFVVRRQYM
ncbi:Aste57867_17310 [Aphanomyces stellatus]|uniref:Aste57867_17310 protein n=1 Tax=Aphanomyces stellatus TaxID=120398 RepID=A0A485L7S3_9STRA|nr:hypothetical protein As57867_017251 [Aphanomyces stellatus]VFT94066.1 Aste57867_17310 [Aphanomyces stellatus]